MHITYYSETDTLSLDFRSVPGPVAETVDGPDEDILLEFDAEGKLVSVLIEHASRRTDLEHLRQQPQFEAAGQKARKTG